MNEQEIVFRVADSAKAELQIAQKFFDALLSSASVSPDSPIKHVIEGKAQSYQHIINIAVPGGTVRDLKIFFLDNLHLAEHMIAMNREAPNNAYWYYQGVLEVVKSIALTIDALQTWHR